MDNFKDAVADIPNGASIMIGGFGGAGGQPTRLMLALRDLGVNDLTIIGNVAGISATTHSVSYTHLTLPTIYSV